MTSNWHTIKNRLLAEKNHSIGIWLLLSTILNLRPYGQRSSYINQLFPALVIEKMPKEKKTEVMQKWTSLFFFHVEQVFPQCRGLISCLGTPQIASTDRYWVYPSAFSNRALNHPMVKCARKKLKQEPDPIHQSNQWKTLSIFTWLEGLHKPKKWKNKIRQDWKHQVRKKRASVVCKCGFQACLPVALSLETGGA